MFFVQRLGPAPLSELCRVLHHSLAAGIPLVKVLQQQAKSGPPPVRALAAAMAGDLERGDRLEAALAKQAASFPPLFRALAAVGEQSGTLPAVFAELERHYQLVLKLRRQFRKQAAKPALDFLIAVVIITGVIWTLGLIADRSGTPAVDPLGLGVTGAAGALLFLALVVGFLVMLAGGMAGVIWLAQRPSGAAFLLRVPRIGACWQAVVLHRLCTALRLTLMTNLPVRQALTLSLRAAGHPTLAAQLPVVLAAVDEGRELTVCLRRTELLPDDFLQALAVAELGGQLPAVLTKQAEHYQEEADQRLTQLTRAAAFLVWLLMAALVTTTILRLFSTVYLGSWDTFG